MKNIEKLKRDLAMAKTKFLIDPSEQNYKNVCDIEMSIYICIRIEELKKSKLDKYYVYKHKEE